MRWAETQSYDDDLKLSDSSGEKNVIASEYEAYEAEWKREELAHRNVNWLFVVERMWESQVRKPVYINPIIMN